MNLRGVHEKRMTEINGAGISSREHLAAMRRLGEPVGGKLTQ